MRLRSFFVATIGVLLAASLALADAPQTGVVTGVVKGPDAAPMPGATVQLQGDRGSQTAVTGAQGKFRFVFIVPGSYRVRADLTSFQPAEGGIVVSAGGRAFVELELGEAMAEEIVVTGEVPLISRYDVAGSSTVEAEVAEKLVFAERTYRSALLMFPGVVPLDRADRTPMVSGGGGNEMATFVDGVDVSVTRSGGTTRMFLPTTAMAEVRMDGSAYGAEYGRAVGGINSSITKSGSNAFHGDFLYIAQNQAWAAQSKHIPLERMDDIQGKFEVGLGGPIYRDKAWFFVAASEGTSNELTHLAGGDIIDYSVVTESQMLKLDFSPTASHRLAVTAVKAPLDWPLVSESLFYDRYTVVNLRQQTEFLTASWNWSVDENMFLELRAAHQVGPEERKTIDRPEVDTGASPDDPAGNQSRYIDVAPPFAYHHGPGTALGGFEFPRDQANAVLTWFGGRHELKFGIDYQNAVMEANFQLDPVYTGRGYNEALPGGFTLPLYKRVYYPAEAPVRTESDVLNVFVQDRFDVGDNWTVILGLRLEDQDHMNDLGETVISSSDLAPRLAAIYDVGGTGKLLVKATAGRYYTLIYQNLINDEFSTSPNGQNAYDQYGWNRVTGLYDKFQRTVLPSQEIAEQLVEPFYKDEITLGFDWQFDPLWVFKARAIYWEMANMFAAQDQFDANGGVYRLAWSIPDAKSDYKALQLELNRRFRSNWVLRTNYTFGQVKGNMTTYGSTFMEGYAVVDPETGEPITAINRWGPFDRDVNHILNIAGSKTFPIGKHSILVGGYLRYYTGRAWNLQESVTLTHPVSGQEITSTYFIEPAGSHRLPGNHYLNLNGTWRFPIAGPVEGSLRVEATAVTNPQEQIGISESTGEPVQNRRSWQKPREFRVVLGVSF